MIIQAILLIFEVIWELEKHRRRQWRKTLRSKVRLLLLSPRRANNKSWGKRTKSREYPNLHNKSETRRSKAKEFKKENLIQETKNCSRNKHHFQRITPNLQRRRQIKWKAKRSGNNKIKNRSRVVYKSFNKRIGKQRSDLQRAWKNQRNNKRSKSIRGRIINYNNLHWRNKHRSLKARGKSAEIRINLGIRVRIVMSY